jgi:hypothetical protein
MADKELEQGLEELESVKQTFKSNIDAKGISTSSIEFRNYPSLINQMEKILPSQTKTVTPTGVSQEIIPDSGYKLGKVIVNAIPEVPSEKGNAIEIKTDTEMTNALTEDNIGKIYKFTGTSDVYETDAIYIISEV